VLITSGCDSVGTTSSHHMTLIECHHLPLFLQQLTREMTTATTLPDNSFYSLTSFYIMSCHSTSSRTGSSTHVQEMIYYGQLTDDPLDMGAFLLAHFKALPRHNPRISGGPAGATAAPQQLPLVGELAPGSAGLASLGYLHHPGTEEGLKSVTHWIVVDVTTEVAPLSPFKAQSESTTFPIAIPQLYVEYESRSGTSDAGCCQLVGVRGGVDFRSGEGGKWRLNKGLPPTPCWAESVGEGKKVGRW